MARRLAKFSIVGVALVLRVRMGLEPRRRQRAP